VTKLIGGPFGIRRRQGQDMVMDVGIICPEVDQTSPVDPFTLLGCIAIGLAVEKIPEVLQVILGRYGRSVFLGG